MGFSSNTQQRIAWSQRTDNVIQNDCAIFECLSKGSSMPAYHTFINRIFCNYYQYSDASIEARIHEEREKLKNLQGNDDHSEEWERFTDKILLDRRKELEKKVEEAISKESSQSRVISLQKETLQILKNSGESEFYTEKHVSRYIRAVIEDYAAADSLSRKRIYYRNIIETLESYIRNGFAIEIQLKNKAQRYKIKPAFISPDKYETHLYLAALSCGDGDKEKVVSYRLDRIDETSIQPLHKSPISPASRNALEEKVNRIGIQYLIEDKVRIRIRLSARGIKKYKQMTFQRPMYSEIEGEEKNVYVFDIPRYQAQVYFFKFGADAVVLEPETLRGEFRKMYRDALKKYEQDNLQ